MKIFVCNLFKTYTVASTVRAMKRMGISVVEKTYYTPEDLYHDEALQAMVEKDVAAAGVDAVFTVNYWPVVARACKSLGMKYLAWSYDSPQNLPTTETMEYETNYIFLFDREEVRRYREKGLTNVHHLLLAVDSAGDSWWTSGISIRCFFCWIHVPVRLTGVDVTDVSL